MNTAIQWISATTNQVRGWSWLKRLLTLLAFLAFASSTYLFYTPQGTQIREFLAETVITTQHRDWAWIFVGAAKRDEMVRQMQGMSDENAKEKQDISAVKFDKNRKIDELVQVKDVSGEFWKGKLMYVYDPRSVRIVVPDKQGEGERITSMVDRTNAVAGINGGGFVDPDGLGNGFAPIGPIISGGKLLYIDQDGNVPQHIVGFTKEGTLVIGKYTYSELQKLGVSEAVMFYPRVIANGKPLITSGDGGWGRGPRTAIGQRADGTVIFAVIDGRQAHSVGATLREIQDLLLAEGCVNAGFLDGGASSEMVYNNELITKPSSHYGERRLPSAFLVFDHPSTLVNKPIWDGLSKIDPGGAYDNPYFQADLKAHPELYKQQSTQQSAKKEPDTKAKADGTAETGTDKTSGSAGTTGSGKTSGTTKSSDTGTKAPASGTGKDSTAGTGKEGSAGTAATSGAGAATGSGNGASSAGHTGTGTGPNGGSSGTGSQQGTGSTSGTGSRQGTGGSTGKTGTTTGNGTAPNVTGSGASETGTTVSGTGNTNGSASHPNDTGTSAGTTTETGGITNPAGTTVK